MYSSVIVVGKHAEGGIEMKLSRWILFLIVIFQLIYIRRVETR